MIGIQKMVQDLLETGYQDVTILQDSNGMQYAVLTNFEVPSGSFAGRIINLAIPAPADYPRSLGASIHIKSIPHLLPFEHIPQKRNIIQSPLGLEWQYWSYQFKLRYHNPTIELITQINEIFRNN